MSSSAAPITSSPNTTSRTTRTTRRKHLPSCRQILRSIILFLATQIFSVMLTLTGVFTTEIQKRVHVPIMQTNVLYFSLFCFYCPLWLILLCWTRWRKEASHFTKKGGNYCGEREGYIAETAAGDSLVDENEGDANSHLTARDNQPVASSSKLHLVPSSSSIEDAILEPSLDHDNVFILEDTSSKSGRKKTNHSRRENPTVTNPVTSDVLSNSLVIDSPNSRSRIAFFQIIEPSMLVVYFLQALFDVQANFLVVKAYQYTTITSVQLLDCFTIPSALFLSFVFLGARYRLGHWIGVLLCLLGIVALIVGDIFLDDATLGMGWKGDVFAITGAMCYAVSNVLEEGIMKKKSSIERFFRAILCFVFRRNSQSMRRSQSSSSVTGALYTMDDSETDTDHEAISSSRTIEEELQSQSMSPLSPRGTPTSSESQPAALFGEASYQTKRSSHEQEPSTTIPLVAKQSATASSEQQVADISHPAESPLPTSTKRTPLENFRSVCELLTFLGLFGFIINSIQVLLFEFNELKQLSFLTTYTVANILAFDFVMFLLYSLVPIFLTISSSTFLNLSLLTSDVYSVLVSVFLLGIKPHFMYYVSFLVIVIGLVMYNLQREARGGKNERVTVVEGDEIE